MQKLCKGVLKNEGCAVASSVRGSTGRQMFKNSLVILRGRDWGAGGACWSVYCRHFLVEGPHCRLNTTLLEWRKMLIWLNVLQSCSPLFLGLSYQLCCISSSLVTLSLSVSSVSLCRLRAFLCSSRLALSSWDSDEATRAFPALSISLLFLRRSSLCASVSDARLALSRAFLFCRLLAVVVFLSLISYRNNLLSDCSNFKCACVMYVTYGDIISNEVHYRLVTELA